MYIYIYANFLYIFIFVYKNTICILSKYFEPRNGHRCFLLGSKSVGGEDEQEIDAHCCCIIVFASYDTRVHYFDHPYGIKKRLERVPSFLI